MGSGKLLRPPFRGKSSKDVCNHREKSAKAATAVRERSTGPEKNASWFENLKAGAKNGTIGGAKTAEQKGASTRLS